MGRATHALPSKSQSFDVAHFALARQPSAVGTHVARSALHAPFSRQPSDSAQPASSTPHEPSHWSAHHPIDLHIDDATQLSTEATHAPFDAVQIPDSLHAPDAVQSLPVATHAPSFSEHRPSGHAALHDAAVATQRSFFSEQRPFARQGIESAAHDAAVATHAPPFAVHRPSSMHRIELAQSASVFATHVSPLAPHAPNSMHPGDRAQVCSGGSPTSCMHPRATSSVAGRMHGSGASHTGGARFTGAGADALAATVADALARSAAVSTGAALVVGDDDPAVSCGAGSVPPHETRVRQPTRRSRDDVIGGHPSHPLTFRGMTTAEARVSVGPGSILRDKWRLDAVLWKDPSGASTVFAATHRNTRRFVVKMLSLEASADPSTVDRFLGRAYAVNTLKHRGLVPTLDDDRSADGRVFVVRDMVDGETLAEVVAREGKGLRPTHVVGLVDQLLAVLSEAHAANIVHGRISLEHVLLGRDDALRLVGFRAASEPALEPVDDVFLVGSLAYRVLTGEPLGRDAPNDPVRAALPTVNPAIARVFDRALDLDRSNRWPTARDMSAALADARELALRAKTGPIVALGGAGASAGAGAPHPASVAGGPALSEAASGPVSAAGGPTSMPRSLSQTGSSDLFTSVDVRRMMPIAVVVAIGSPPADVFRNVITSAVTPDGIRAEFASGSSALLVPPALTLAHEEAAIMARAALKLRAMGAPVKTTLLLGQDLLTRSGSTERAVARALERTATRAATHIEVDPSLAFLLEQRFVLTRADGALTLDAPQADEASSRVLGRIIGCFGRASEIDSIASLVARARRDASARALVVVGRSGVGKTRLVAEVVARVRRATPDAQVWTARATPTGRTTALGVLRELVRGACGIPRAARGRDADRAIATRVAEDVWDRPTAARITAELVRLSGGALSDETSDHPAPRLTDAGAEGDRELCAFQDFFAAVVARRPLLVVVEDMHHADLASIHAIDRTLEHLHDHPWALVATARPEIDEIAPQLWASSGAVRTELGPLDGASRLALAHAVLGADRETEAADVARASGGNPRFIEECARLGAQRKEAGVAHGSAAGFAAAEDLVRARLALLDVDARVVLSLASAFGEAFWFRGLAHLVQQRIPAWRLGSYLDAFARAELIAPVPDARFVGEAEFAFANQTVEAEAYALLSTSEREVTHHLAGQWLERAGERDSAVLAGHFARSESQVEAASWHERSAAEALEKNDIGAALTLAERGLSYVQEGELAQSLHLTSMECYAWRAEAARARPHAERVYREARAGSTLWCRAVAGLAFALPKCLARDASAELSSALRAFDGAVQHPRAFASALSNLSTYMLRQGQHEHYRGLTERLAALERAGDPVVRAHALEARSWLAMFHGDFGQCLHFDREAMRLFTEAGDLRNACRATTSIGYDLMSLGQYELSEKAFRAALATAMRLGIPRAELTSRQHLTMVLLRLGRPEEAIDFGSQALSIALRGGDTFIAGSTRVYFALALALQQDLENAAAQLVEATRELGQDSASDALSTAELARVRLLQGRNAEALSHATTAMSIVAESGVAEEGDAIIRLAYVEALFAMEQRPAAVAALASAWKRVADRAALVTDPELRRSFLERVPEHQRTAELARREGLA